VHLSGDIETAIKVGQRHGKPFVFKVFAEQMYNDNFQFFISDNGVWLTDNVPIKYLKRSDE
ncbi:MAG TPA: RNA 2'-phosphotransferase, partial [Chitinophagaceae bacterium]|nr:RNA 2'-phosphotransferase [Chitinophagaceae bacterium]